MLTDGRVRTAAATLDAAAAAASGGDGAVISKRARSDIEGGGAVAAEGDSDDDFAAALSKIKGEIVTEINASTSSLLDNKLDKTATMLKNYTDKKCGKLDDQFIEMRK